DKIVYADAEVAGVEEQESYRRTQPGRRPRIAGPVSEGAVTALPPGELIHDRLECGHRLAPVELHGKAAALQRERCDEHATRSKELLRTSVRILLEVLSCLIDQRQRSGAGANSQAGARQVDVARQCDA